MTDRTLRSTPAGERAGGLLRLALGLGQMFGAVLSAVLLVRTGAPRLALGTVVLTCLLTTVSVLLFGSRAPRESP